MPRTICIFSLSENDLPQITPEGTTYQVNAKPATLQRSASREYFVSKGITGEQIKVITWQLTIEEPNIHHLEFKVPTTLTVGDYQLIAEGDIVEVVAYERTEDDFDED